MMRSRFGWQARTIVSGCAALGLFMASGCGDQGSQVGTTPKPARPASAASTVPSKPAALNGAPAAGQTSCAGQQTCTSTDAHAKHQASGFDCVSCHPCGAQYGFRVGYAFPGGTTIQASDKYTPASGTQPATCTVACHYPLGSPASPVGWKAPGPLACVGCHDVPTLLANYKNHPQVSPTSSRADCEKCHVVGSQHTSGTVVLQSHPASWMVRTDPGFHAFSAVRGLAACQACHLKDLSGGVTKTACVGCHKAAAAGGTASDFATCYACHGGTSNLTGAPPAAIWGQAGDPSRGGGTADPIRVGAHTAHVAQGQFGPAFGCEVCHVKPADLLAPNHIDDIAEGATPLANVTFSGLAVNGVATPTWSRGTATCASTYCHGATLASSPGTLKNPVWTGGASQVYCGSCHGVPPPPPHVQVSTAGGFGVCSPCHSLTVDGAGSIIPASVGGKHLNGLLEASGHDASWMDRTSPGFHAFSANRGIANCTACHGADLGGGSVGVGCNACHKSGGQANDFATCTACHGGRDNQTGAPPAAIWGYAGDPNRGGGSLDPIRVGAHTKHVQTTKLARPFDCGVCHLKPTGILSAGHIDDPTPVATLTFGGIAGQVPPGPAPSWNRGTATCASTYCHGNYAGTYTYTAWDWGSDSPVEVSVSYAGSKAAPGWLDGPMTCGSCHGNPPAGTGAWHSGFHGYDVTYRECQTCHPDAASVNGVGTSITNPALHLNGIVEVTPKWSNKCFGCH
jgi:predicted CxxxxCH...CXXCH cytochrome family protein